MNSWRPVGIIALGLAGALAYDCQFALAGMLVFAVGLWTYLANFKKKKGGQ